MNNSYKSKIKTILSRANGKRRFMGLCVIVGVVGGLAAIALHLSISKTFQAIWKLGGLLGEDNRFWLMPLLPALGGLIVGACVSTFARSASGGGIPRTKAVFCNEFGVFRFRDIIYRFVLSTVFCGFGNSSGREGPTVHLCAASASVIAQKLGFAKRDIQASVPVGVTAGISASFNAPLSAITFVFEEFIGGFRSSRAMGGIVIAVLVAATLSRLILGENPVLQIANADFRTDWWMLVCIPLAIAAGLFGHLFLKWLIKLRGFAFFKIKLPKFLVPALGGLIVGVIAMAAYRLTGSNAVFSVGYEVLPRAFSNEVALRALLILFVCKFAASLINYGMGGSGGIFSPAIVIGGMLGASFGGIAVLLFGLDPSVVGACMLLGMGACLASIIRCPITSILIVFEITLNYSLILPLIAGNLLAYFIAARLSPVGIYDSILLQDKISLKQLPAYRGQRDWANLPISAIMTFDVESVCAGETAGQAAKRISESAAPHRAYPVLDCESRFIGICHAESLFNAANSMEECSSLLHSDADIFLFPDASIQDAANFLIEKDVLEAAIVNRNDNSNLVGILTLHDIARQQNASENENGY